MPKKLKKRPSKSESKPPAKGKAHPGHSDQAQLPGDPRFVSDLLIRGEAATLDKDGKLPLQATHVIQKKNPDGSIEVKRARFKLF